MRTNALAGSRRKRASAQAGVALVEFALVVPLLMLLLLGGIETGRFAYFSILVGNAARAGVQYGSQSLLTAGDSAGMKAAAEADGQNVPGLTATSAGLVCSCWNGTAASALPDCTPGSCPLGSHRVVYVQVTVTGTMNPLFQYPGLPSSYAVTRQAIMRVSSQ